MRMIFALATVTLIMSASITHAGGFLADVFVKPFSPDAAKALDDAHREIKEAIPVYGAVEEGLTNVVQETRVQQIAPLLAAAIQASKQQALADGVERIPDNIRANLENIVSADDLNRVRWRSGGGGDLSLQQNSFKYGDSAAITLDDVVVFASREDALQNIGLWAHEMRHVTQYREWGVYDFSIRYIRDYKAVERDAEEFSARWAAQNITTLASQSPNADLSIEDNRQNLSKPVVPLTSFSQKGQMCSTAMGQCAMPYAADIGGPCWCGTQYGASVGSITALPVQTQSANACQTWAGMCQLYNSTSVGSFCTCTSPYGVYPGMAQLAQYQSPPPAQACVTQFGSCQMMAPTHIGSSCYCQSQGGPIFGVAQ